MDIKQNKIEYIKSRIEAQLNIIDMLMKDGSDSGCIEDACHYLHSLYDGLAVETVNLESIANDYECSKHDHHEDIPMHITEAAGHILEAIEIYKELAAKKETDKFQNRTNHLASAVVHLIMACPQLHISKQEDIPLPIDDIYEEITDDNECEECREKSFDKDYLNDRD